jgi:G3E family GTPase
MILVLISGFLGSGKSTALARACAHLRKNNKRIGVITNDQGDQQVDNAYFRSLGIAAGEVSNGCFCCHYYALNEQIDSIQLTEQPDFIFAESVGSCVDLVATLAKPLGQFRSNTKTVVSVFADAKMLIDIIEERAAFLEESVRYIYKKQLEEADLLILNKTDLLTAKQLGTVDKILKSEYPHPTILHQSSLSDEDVARWVEVVTTFTQHPKRSSLDIDYDIYGSGEAELAWLDKRIVIDSEANDAPSIANKIIGDIFDAIQQERLTIGHLKFFVEGDGWQEKVSFTTTSTGQWRALQPRSDRKVRMLINARVQTDPVLLLTMIDRIIGHASTINHCHIDTGQWAAFKPGYPRPTHRIA